ncbi:MAG: HAMP domain-containing histidine kinase [Bacteroidales bacterium]|nr:HAMP domain-containing histidine kinase [Bacteroidales bacterium]
MKRKSKYKFRLFFTAAGSIWLVILGFAYLVVREEYKLRRETIVERIDLAAACIADAQTSINDLDETVRFVKDYLEDTYLSSMVIRVYDRATNKVVASVGDGRYTAPQAAFEHARVTQSDGTRLLRLMEHDLGKDRNKLYYYSSRYTADGALDIRVAVPKSADLVKATSVDPIMWIFILTVGALGTLLAYISTSHQARNVSLLHDFAQRAAADKDFIPMGDFPSDEIGEISRQIVAIYNSRMQANVRREREHVIALKATQDKNNMKKMLTDNISHELKTPIGIIRAYVEMLINQPDMPEKDRMHFLEKAKVNVERLVSMLNDLSTMTRLDESGGNIPIKEIDFHSMIFNLADDVVRSGIIHGMDFRYNIPTECNVMGNEGLLNSILQNLIKNSAAYSQGTEMGIELIGRNNRYFTFSFYDNGTGVSQEHITHLFDRFYRVDSGRSRKAGGTGLGLAIVKSSIITMGGSITVRNRRGGGLEFVFTLPRPRANGGSATSVTAAPGTPPPVA